MQDSDFEFPPDQIGNDGQIFATSLDDVPFSVLSQTPTDQLPRTHIPNAEHRSIRQLMRGALHDYHKRTTTTASRVGGDYHRGAEARNGEMLGSHAAGQAATAAEGVETSNHTDVAFDEFSLQGVNAEAGSSPGVQGSANGGTHAAHETLSHSHRGGPSAATAAAHDGWGPKPVVRVRWTEGELHDFYKALSQYGTDFGAMSVLFQHHTRQELKRLYLREMRRNPAEVRSAFENRTAIDLEQFNKYLAQNRRRHEAPKKVLDVEEEELLQMIARSGDSGGGDTAAVATATATAASSGKSARATDVATSHRGGANPALGDHTSLVSNEFDFDDMHMNTPGHDHAARANSEVGSSEKKRRKARAVSSDTSPPAQHQKEMVSCKLQRSPKSTRVGDGRRSDHTRSERKGGHRSDEGGEDRSGSCESRRSGAVKRCRRRAAEAPLPRDRHCSSPSAERSPAPANVENADDETSESPQRTTLQSASRGSSKSRERKSSGSRRPSSRRSLKQPRRASTSGTRSIPRDETDDAGAQTPLSHLYSDIRTSDTTAS